MKHKDLAFEIFKDTPHTVMVDAFSQLTPLQVALLLDCVVHVTVRTGYIDGNDDLEAIKDALSDSLALHVIYKGAL